MWSSRRSCVSAAGAMRDRAGRALEVERERATRARSPASGFETLRTFVAVHRGDYFGTLVAYRRLCRAQGVRIPDGARRAPSSRSGARGATSATSPPSRSWATLPRSRELGLRLGGSRRRLADRGGRLDTGPEQVSARRRRHDRAGGRSRPPDCRPSCGGRRWRPTRARDRTRAPGLVLLNEDGAAEDHLVELVLSLPGARRVRENAARAACARRSATGVSTA